MLSSIFSFLNGLVGPNPPNYLFGKSPTKTEKTNVFNKTEYKAIKRALNKQCNFYIYDEDLDEIFPVTGISQGKDPKDFFFFISSAEALTDDTETEAGEGSVLIPGASSGYNPLGYKSDVNNEKYVYEGNKVGYVPGHINNKYNAEYWKKKREEDEKFTKNKAGQKITSAGGFLVDDEEVLSLADETPETPETTKTDTYQSSSGALIPFHHGEWEWGRDDTPSYFDPDTGSINSGTSVYSDPEHSLDLTGLELSDEQEAIYDADKLIEEWTNEGLQLSNSIDSTDEANDPFYFSENPTAEQVSAAVDYDYFTDEEWQAEVARRRGNSADIDSLSGPRLDPQTGLYVPARYLPQGAANEKPSYNNPKYSGQGSSVGYYGGYSEQGYGKSGYGGMGGHGAGYKGTFVSTYKKRDIIADNGMRLDIVNVRVDGITIPATPKYKNELASVLDNKTPAE